MFWEAGEGTEGATVLAWRAAEEAERSPWSWGLMPVGGREEGRVRNASWEVTLEWFLKEKEVCQADKWTGWGPPQRRNSMCKGWRPTCIRGILGPSASSAGPGAGWQKAWVSGLQRALLGPLCEVPVVGGKRARLWHLNYLGLPSSSASCQLHSRQLLSAL